jgi:autotransporter passenger strand-loop-strand repeat protein
MTRQTTSGFSALYVLCRASNGSAGVIESAVRGIALASGGAGRAGGAKVIDGGAAVSGVEIAAVSRAVAEAWQSSGGSRALFEAKLKKRLGLEDGGRKFLAALSLACVLQTTVTPMTAWAEIEVSNGVTSSNLTIGSGGSETTMQVYGTVSSTTVNSTGFLNVYSGGSADATTVNSGGVQAVAISGTATSTTLNAGGEEHVMDGGSAIGTVINSGGLQDVYTGGTADSTVVSAGGLLGIANGGSALNVVQSSGGNIWAVVQGGSTYVSGTNASGSAFSLANGSANNFIIYSGGGQTVTGGGVATGTTVYSGGSQDIWLGTANSTTINAGGTQEVHNGGDANNTTVNSGGSQNVSSGGVATSTTVNSGGAQAVHSGGTANNATVNSGGNQNVNSGGAANSTTVTSGGSQNVSSGGTAYNTTVSSGGALSVSSGGILAGSNVIADGAVFSATQVILNSGDSLRLVRETADSLGTVFAGGGGLIKDGAGTLTLTGANTFTGPLSIDAGGLTLGATGSLVTNSLSLAANTVFDYSAASYAFQNLTVRGLNANIAPGTGGAIFTGANLSYLVPLAAVNGGTLLAITGTNIAATIDSATSVTLAYASGRPNIGVGDNLVLLDVTGGTLTDSGFTQLTVQTPSGDIFELQVSPTQLLAVLQQLAPTGPAYARLKAYAESRAASLAFANQGLDFVLNRGFGSALAATSGPGFRSGSFGGLGGGWSRYDTGSHIDVSGTSLLAGVALGSDIPHGRLTLGAFFEGGWGNYDSRNSFSNAASVHGKGDASYYGGGILGRYDVTEGALSGLYFDASARVGRAKTDFRTGDIQYNGWQANFDSSSLYYGLHGGLGYVWKLTDKASLDLSAKLLWTRQQGDNVTVWQDRVRFKDADSLRTRLGGRFAYAVNEYVSPYVGVYWEHEFDGKQRISVNSRRLSAPSLEGDTGMGELGLTWKPSKTLPLSFDLGVQGYAGEREGVAGSLQVKVKFEF